MHELDPATQNGLAVYYLLAALLNLGFAWFAARGNDLRRTGLWGGVAVLFFVHSAAYAFSPGWTVPEPLTHFVDRVTNAVTYFLASCVLFGLVLYFRKFFTNPVVALVALDVSLLAAGWAMTNPDFYLIIAKADNIPIVILMFSVSFFTWLGLNRAVVNDGLIAQGKPPLEKDDEKVLVWPDLVYTELIAMVVATAVLVVWAVFLKAPLEQPATTAKAPNPSKAPWYFLGLQEMLVYFDPWMAGVVLPTMIITGLTAMPYIDFNPKGNGYYTFKERSFALTTFLFGFLVLWVVLIVLGTLLRGPNWNFFGPFETWDPHKVVPLNNVNLSEAFWLSLGAASVLNEGSSWVVRELPGFIVMAAYFLLIPPLLAHTVLRPYFLRMGFVRYFLLVIHLQFMALLPIKMVLRWVFNLKYIIYIPEYFLNL